MQQGNERQLTVREYARQEGITIQAVYHRIWDGRVIARQIYGRWLISPEQQQTEDRVGEAATA